MTNDSKTVSLTIASAYVEPICEQQPNAIIPQEVAKADTNIQENNQRISFC